VRPGRSSSIRQLAELAAQQSVTVSFDDARREAYAIAESFVHFPRNALLRPGEKPAIQRDSRTTLPEASLL
jgi:hypothetical protein